ncbi:DUF2777 family protein [Anaerobacillus sp. CMMVII]|uniref:DUF2777 domain-containing protein n=1 Tax=Anaerobacillus sp. CMMVII TaxID=2755588 RepID=UPI0021B7E47A|nr:DUF2777 domain-containing protein [Anaerobacillus sp. CMMVII]MCT8138951.1 DUF2777 family protein [Anaerobacillus sp. CMMVII]
MNRKEANNHIGKKIRVVDPLLGSYIGELIDVVAEPRKPWRGKVTITAIEQYPVQNLTDMKDQALTYPPFADGKTYEIPGSKIEPVGDIELELNYNESLINALLNEINHFQAEKNKLARVLNDLQVELRKVDPAYEISNQDELDYQYYTVVKEDDYIYIVDENNNQVPLDDCPFDFQIRVKGRWITVHYSEDLVFLDQKQNTHYVSEGSKIRLNKDQFDPYHIFINELEKPALDSLNNGIQKFRMSHDHCVTCHNTLLNQYLASEEEKKFIGVNFISYQKGSETLLVQHHYERDINEDGDDITYDRFEFTNDQGKRLLMTYTTEKTK